MFSSKHINMQKAFQIDLIMKSKGRIAMLISNIIFKTVKILFNLMSNGERSVALDGCELRLHAG